MFVEIDVTNIKFFKVVLSFFDLFNIHNIQIIFYLIRIIYDLKKRLESVITIFM